jgi:hypothetical protein
MPRLLSNRKPVARPEDLKENRYEYLNLQQAQPALGLAPSNDQGFTLQTDATGKVTYTNTLGKLKFEDQVISSTEEETDIEINGEVTDSNIILTPFQYARIEGNLEVSADIAVTGQATVDGNFRVSGIPLGTFPLVNNTLYVTPDGDDRNDGTAMDSTRACRTISGAVRSPFYQPGTAIKVLAGTYFEDNPIPLKPYTSVVGSDLRTTFVEPLNKDLDLFHVNSGVYIAQMQMRNLRRGAVERYAPGGAGTYTTGAYCVAFPPNLENPIDVYYSPYIQNCTNQSGPWLKDGTMFVPNQTVQIPLAAGTSTWAANENQITVTLTTGTIAIGMAVNDAANEGYRNAQLLLERNKEFLQKQVVAYVNEVNENFEYNRDKCYRDVGYIVDAVSRDARFGGNKRSIEAGLAYWLGSTSLITGEQTETINAIDYLKSISLEIVVNNTVTNVYDTSTNQIIDLNLDKGQVVLSRIAESYNLIASIIESGETVVPATRDDLYGLIYPTGLSPNAVNVASTITAITTISGNTFLITLSTSTVSPSDNATVYFGYTSVYPFLDQDVPEEWRMPDDDGIFADRRLDPTGSGGGALVDGNAPSLISPIQSFVFDAFTQVNQGGIGIHIINNGYAQLVSVFTIMCSQAVIVENGGIASITNSNANFGDTCLTAKGLGKLAYQGFVVNPAFPTNVPNGEFYPLGFWPQRQEMEVFLPSDRDRPHIGQVMEVVPPDTYINFEGNRVPFINEAGYPGYLIVTVNTGTITTGSYTISDIDVTGIAVGHTLYVRDVLGDEVSPVTGEPYITTGTQVVDVNYRSITLDRPILTGYSDPLNPSWFNLYFCGNAYYTVLSSRIDNSLASTVTTQATLVPGQETTTSLAISYAKNLALRVIQNIPVTGFVYDKVKCARDTGIIVDSIVSDLLFNENGYTQANFSGLQYWNQSGYTGTIAEEITTTTNAINFVKELAFNVIQNITTGSYVTTTTQNTSLPVATTNEAEYIENEFDIIVNILTSGTNGVTDLVVANGINPVSEDAQKGYDILQANKEFIQEQAIAFVEDTKTTGFEYDVSLCYRDVGYMIDSVSFDLLYGGNRQAIQSGVYYYGFSEIQSTIPGEQVQTTAAYRRLQEILASIVTNTTIRKSLTNTLTQITTLTTSTSVIGLEISSIVNKITSIINDGPEAADAKQPISQTKTTSTDVLAAVDILLANREFIKSEIISYVDAQYGSGFVYDQGKCKRDTGLIVDAIALDLFHPTTELSQSNFAGLQYWNQDSYVGTIANEVTTTTNAVRYIQQLSKDIVLGITTGTRYQSTVTQITSSSVATQVEADIIAQDFEVIIDILVDGIAGVTDKIIPNGFQTTSPGIVNAYSLLIANKEYIQAEAVAFVEDTKTSGFTYDQSLCYRDVGYMIDSVAFDLLHPNGSQPSNKQAVQSGVYYYGYNEAESAIAGEIPQTTAAYNYIKELIPYVVQGFTATTYQTFVPQVTNLTTSSGSVITELQSYIDHIVDIINNGPESANDKVPINLEETLDVDAFNAYNMLMANRSFIQEEVIAFINSQNSLGTYQNVYPQVIDNTLIGGEDAIPSVTEKFDIIANIIKDGAESSPEIRRPRQYVDFNQNILNAKKLLEKNRLFIQAETVAFVDSIWPSKFSYDPVKCSRDTGLIVDALVQDLLFDGTSQSTFAGIQYWNQGLTVIPGEQTTTTNAVKYLKNLSQQIIKNDLTGYRYQSTVTQITSTVTVSTDAVALTLGTKFDVIIDILKDGTEGITDKIIPNGINSNTSTATISAYALLQSNKEFLQHETIAWVEANSNFRYDQDKCSRDTGLIVDAIALDILYPTSTDSQSTFAGLQYWNQDGYVGTIEDEITTTTNAITYLSSIAQKVVVGDTSGTRYQTTITQTTSTSTGLVSDAVLVGTDFGVILNILSSGTVGVTDVIIPNGRRSINTSTVNAYNLLIENKEYLIAETIAYVEDTKADEFEYDQTKCARDVGYMIDSVAFDLLHGGNKQAVQSGVLYYGYISTSTAIVNEIPQTTAAYNRIREILPNILTGVKITPSRGNDTKQITYMLPTNNSQIVAAQTKIDKITNIINNGPSVASTLTAISLVPSTDPNADKAYDLLVANREFIKDEIIAYINSNFTGFEYDKSKCFRDVGYMIDSISFDLLYGGNRQSIQSGVYYYGYEEESSAIEGEIPQTTSAYNFIEQIVENIITGNVIDTPQQTLIPQVVSTSTGTLVEVSLIKNNINLINNIIENGPDEVLVKEPISLDRSTSTTVINAANLLNLNRDFIRAETIAFINNTYNTGFLYDKTKCRRDTGLIVDSIAADLLYEGTTESTFAGLQYWNQADYTGTIKGEITTTTNAIRYLKELVQQVVINEPVEITSGNTTTQITNLTASNTAIAQVVAGNVDVILNILTNGTVGVTDIIVPNGKAVTDPEIVAAHAILQANKDFLKEEIVARINLDNTEFDYDRETCKRDIGYIVDSISFDVLHGGNRQSVASGVYYYGFDAADTAIDDQIPQTTAAYNYIKNIVGKIVKSEPLGTTAQLKVKQVLSVNTATDVEVSLLEDKIDIITDIINNGPDIAPSKQPISQVVSTSTAVANAYDLLMANRSFIQAEVLAHIDAVFTNTPNYDKDKCFRDMGAVVDAVGYDLIYGGNYNSVNTGNGYFLRKGQYHIVRLEANVTDPTLFIDGATVRFYQQSYISASGYLFEYVGAGTQYGALPQVGTADPNQTKEVVQLNNGKVFFTSTDQNGDFRIGPTLVISQSTGVLSGRTFQKSLYAEMTPFILVVGA